MKRSSPIRWLVVLVCCWIVVLLSGCGGAAGPSNGKGGGGGGNSSATVAVIVLENTSYEHVIGSGSMPFLNSLVPQGGLATQYFGDIHPSMGDYFMLTTGQIINNQDTFTGDVSDDNIVRHLVAAGKTWKGYFQSLPSPGYTGGDAYPYIEHHNPLSYFTDVRQNSAEAANLVPLTQLAADESAGALPNFMFIAPDDEHDAHDCPSGATAVCAPDDKLAAADAFLSANVPALLNNAALKQNGLVMIVFDEGDLNDLRQGGGHAVMLVLGPHAKAGVQSATLYKHENALRTISNLLGVPAPGADASAAAMSDLVQ